MTAEHITFLIGLAPRIPGSRSHSCALQSLFHYLVRKLLSMSHFISLCVLHSCSSSHRYVLTTEGGKDAGEGKWKLKRTENTRPVSCAAPFVMLDQAICKHEGAVFVELAKIQMDERNVTVNTARKTNGKRSEAGGGWDANSSCGEILPSV